jgi:hypothetical protein
MKVESNGVAQSADKQEDFIGKIKRISAML